MSSSNLLVSKVILASSSSYRRDLLQTTGLEFSCETAGVDEAAIVSPVPRGCAIARAVAKAKDVALKHPGCLVIGADQVLEFDGMVLGKLDDAQAARRRMELLAGSTHLLWSAVNLTYASPEEEVYDLYTEAIRVPMEMRQLTTEELDAYFTHCEQWQGVVGCYKYEQLGGQLFSSVGGDHSAIIGLPLIPLTQALRALGINPLINPNGPWSINSG